MIDQIRSIVSGKRVALVGNAMSLLKENRGGEIDEHDIVIRINKGLPEFVGSSVGQKTDVWVTARHFKEVDPRRFRLTIFMKLTRLGDLEWSRLSSSDEGVQSPIVRWPLDLATECMAYCKCDPGCGLRMLWLLKKKLDPSHISVFGMDGWKTPSSWNPEWHKFNNHNPARERQIIEELCKP